MTRLIHAMQTTDIFSSLEDLAQTPIDLPAGTHYLKGFACKYAPELIVAIKKITTYSPFRQIVTPGGKKMSVTITNCGTYGWISDRYGYRYSTVDPLSHQHWLALPSCFVELVNAALSHEHLPNYQPDACLINNYSVGAKMGLHQDKDEKNFTYPIVSVSLGLPALFLLGGLTRNITPRRILLQHGDIIILTQQSRLRFHGVLPIQPGYHAELQAQRINLTFRKVT